MSNPFVTVSGVSYEVSKLSEKAQMFLQDLVRTVQEYNGVFGTYRQSLTLTNTYSGGLKTEIEKANLPTMYTAPGPDSNVPSIKIDETIYDASNLPEEVEVYVSELMKAGNQKANLEFRLRQLDAARITLLNVLQNEIEESKPEPMDPQPSLEEANAA